MESVRLSSQVIDPDDDSRVQGIVEILFDSRWGYICRPTEIQTNEVVAIVCRGLGYQGGGARIIGTPSRA